MENNLEKEYYCRDTLQREGFLFFKSSCQDTCIKQTGEKVGGENKEGEEKQRLLSHAIARLLSQDQMEERERRKKTRR